MGINTALRISDLLELQVKHFLDDHQNIKRRFWIKEQKRGKRQEVVVNTSIQGALEEYFVAYPEIIGDQNNFIFFNTMDNAPLLDLLDWTCSRWELEPKIAVGDAK